MAPRVPGPVFTGSSRIPAALVWRKPSTEWFNRPVTKDVALAPTPGTLDMTAVSEYGGVNVPSDQRIEVVHLHQYVDGSTGQQDLELYRHRAGVDTLIATISHAALSGVDLDGVAFTFVDDAYKDLKAWDYLYLQATSKMGGAPIAFVDIHFDTYTFP